MEEVVLISAVQITPKFMIHIAMYYTVRRAYMCYNQHRLLLVKLTKRLRFSADQPSYLKFQ
jgi:hypothetical protein